MFGSSTTFFVSRSDQTTNLPDRRLTRIFQEAMIGGNQSRSSGCRTHRSLAFISRDCTRILLPEEPWSSAASHEASAAFPEGFSGQICRTDSGGKHRTSRIAENDDTVKRSSNGHSQLCVLPCRCSQGKDESLVSVMGAFDLQKDRQCARRRLRNPCDFAWQSPGHGQAQLLL